MQYIIEDKNTHEILTFNVNDKKTIIDIVKKLEQNKINYKIYRLV